jgi:putative lipoic acid-binding regulatory protein
MSDDTQTPDTSFKDKEETLLTFPCEFPIKIMGKAHEDLKTLVLETLAKHAPEFDEAVSLTIKESKDANYHAITAVIQAQSKAQLDSIYEVLSANDLVLMAL